MDADISSVNTYHYGKAGYDNMTKMLQTATNSSCIAFTNHLDDMKFIYDVMFDTWKDFGGVVKPMEWEDALRFKDKDTTNGFPLKSKIS